MWNSVVRWCPTVGSWWLRTPLASCLLSLGSWGWTWFVAATVVRSFFCWFAFRFTGPWPRGATSLPPKSLRGPTGTVRVWGKQVVRTPGGVMKLASSTCSQQFSGQSMLFEPSESGLPAGLLASHCLVQIVRGTVYVPVVSVWTTQVILYPRTILGILGAAQVVSLPAGVTEVESTLVTISSQTVVPSIPNRIESLTWAGANRC